MNLLLAVGLGVGAFGVVKLLDSAAKNKRTCRIPTDVAIFQANQAFLSKDVMLIQATMTIFEAYGCHGEAAAMRSYLTSQGYNPDVAILPAGAPMSNGQILLQPGEVWRAAAILGGVGCAVGLQTIAEKVAEKGFTQVTVYGKNPGWGSAWDANEGFLECTRYVQATVAGKARSMAKPKQVYRLERVSTAS